MTDNATKRKSGRSPSRLPYVFALLFMGAVVVAAWVGRDSFTPVISGELAPEFTATTLDGETRTLASFEGKVVLLNIWATWCPPCREEMPSMQRLYEIIDDPDFEIVAVSVDASLSGALGWGGRIGGNVEAFAEEMGLTFPILVDPAGVTADTYRSIALPETFVIGKDGIIYKKVAGGTYWDSDEYVTLIQRLLES